MIVGATPMCIGKICCNFSVCVSCGAFLNYCSMDKIFVEEILVFYFFDRWEFYYNLVDEVKDL
jgi:hypothetical protein